jgi:hypothetical protein
MRPTTKIVENGIQALEAVKELHKVGYTMEDIYVLAHHEDVTHKVAVLANVNEIGIKEEGVLNSLANLVRSRGDEMRSKLQSMGYSEMEAGHLEEELDKGHILVISVAK